MKCDIFRGITKLRCVAVKSPWAAAGRGREEIEWGAIGRSVCEGEGGSLHLHPGTPLLALRSLHSSPTQNRTEQNNLHVDYHNCLARGDPSKLSRLCFSPF